MTILLDSVILIDHFNGIPAATAYIRMVHATAAISVVTRAEVLTGFDEASLPKALPLLDLFPVLDITKPVADLTARIRREHRWKLPDALQAALAQSHNLQLATRNTKDFDPAKHPFVTIPYSLA
jgi:predicted nucleic acid-binding protein